MEGNEKEEKGQRPGARGVKLCKQGKYEEAISEFTKFLKKRLEIEKSLYTTVGCHTTTWDNMTVP